MRASVPLPQCRRWGSLEPMTPNNAPAPAPEIREWSCRVGQRRNRPPDPGERRGRPLARPTPTKSVQTATDNQYLGGQPVESNHLATLRAEVHARVHSVYRCGRLSVHTPLLSPEQRVERNEAGNFDPSFKVFVPLFDRNAPHRLAADRHMRLRARLVGIVGGPLPRIGKIRRDEREADELTAAASDFRSVIMKQPALAKGEDAELARRWRDHGDQDALDLLVASHLRMVLKAARKIKAKDIGLEDLISIGSVAIATAAQSYDPDRGLRFATFARRPVQWAMWDAARPKVADGYTVSTVSLNAPVGEEGETFLDRLESPADDDDGLGEVRARLPKAMRRLEPRELQVIELRYGGDEMTTRYEIAAALGISGERVRQIEEKAILRMRRRK